MIRTLVLNGPNLGRLGRRDIQAYGATSSAELEALCIRGGAELGLRVDFRQTDSESELIGWLHEAVDTPTPVVLNAAGLSHTSVAVADACEMLIAPLVEVHLSNIYAREPFRAHSYVTPHAAGVIAGLGAEGYVLALSWLASELEGEDDDDDDFDELDELDG